MTLLIQNIEATASTFGMDWYEDSKTSVHTVVIDNRTLEAYPWCLGPLVYDRRSC